MTASRSSPLPLPPERLGNQPQDDARLRLAPLSHPPRHLGVRPGRKSHVQLWMPSFTVRLRREFTGPFRASWRGGWRLRPRHLHARLSHLVPAGYVSGGGRLRLVKRVPRHQCTDARMLRSEHDVAEFVCHGASQHVSHRQAVRFS